MRNQNIHLLQRLLTNLLQTSCTICTEEETVINDIQRMHCFLPQLQPQLSPQILREQLSRLKNYRICELRDKFGLRLLMFRFEGEKIIIGPFVTESWEDVHFRGVLTKYNLADTYLIPYKLYYSRYPIIQILDALHVIQSVTKSLRPDDPGYQHRVIHEPEKHAPVPLQPQDVTNFDMVVERYARENRLLALVRKGDTQGALKAMRSLNPMTVGVNYDVMAGNGIGSTSAIRTLLRKAAESAGVHPAVVDSISEVYAQKANAARTTADMAKLTPQMVREFCEAVQETIREDYPPVIKRAVDYIKLHISSPLALSRIAEVAGVTPNYLSHAFKNATGMSVMQYIAKVRCEKAADLLRSTQLPIQDISNYVGYPDSNYFVKIFKTQYGITPSQYRKNIDNPLDL